MSKTYTLIAKQEVTYEKKVIQAKDKATAEEKYKEMIDNGTIQITELGDLIFNGTKNE